MARTAKIIRSNIGSFVPAIRLVLAALVLAALVGAFSYTARAQEARPDFFFGSHKANLSNIVVVGDSLSAGFQSDSLLDTAQPHGWAAVVAAQAHTPLVLPLIAPPGIPSVLELLSFGPPPLIEPAPGTSPGRDDPFVQATDLAVPGAELQDVLTTAPSLPIDSLTDLVIGLPGLLDGVSKTQVQWAQTLQPTTIFLWIGSNDILGAASIADPSAATPLNNFASNYNKLLNELSQTGATLVVANIPDVTVVPYFTPAATIAQEAGLPQFVVDPILGIGPGDYVLPDGVALVPGILTGSIKGPLPSSDVLRAPQVLETRAIIDAYNIIIAVEAFTHGAVLVDIHALADQIRSQGIEADGHHLTNAFLGGAFSLDGIHPTNTAYAVIANQFITALNQQRGTNIPLVDINLVASTDPLIFSELAPATSIGKHVTPAVAASMRALFLHTSSQK
ncbi:MAG: SGNH/GDSL hydrolase family protein [Candidatus Acidiferrales bacterium]|jgi:lysophospholipase L1-like esterase